MTRFTQYMACFAIALMTQSAFAEHFIIELSMTSKAEKTTSSADTNSPQRQQGFKPRPVCHAKVGEELTFQFFVTSNFPHDAIKNVTMRYFIVAEENAGQDAVPNRDKAIMQGHFVMDFKPETGKVGLRQRMTIDKPGVYLVRVGSENTDTDHEHFSALDVVVE